MESEQKNHIRTQMCENEGNETDRRHSGCKAKVDKNRPVMWIVLLTVT